VDFYLTVYLRILGAGMIIYIHGFGSSGKAFKARLLKRLYPEVPLYSPDLLQGPQHAIKFLEDFILNKCDLNQLLLIGSSLGGYYALHLHVKYHLFAVLLNPAVRATSNLESQIENHSNFDPAVSAEWQQQYLPHLAKYYHSPQEIHYERLYVYLNRDDEILNYRIAEEYFKQSNCTISLFEHGGHVFLNFPQILPEIISVYDQISP
jgi:predicted esterase YcpF (UPF0227 family)